MVKVVVIEDDIDLCDTLYDALKADGHTVDTYYTGTEAIDAFIRKRISADVVVLDMQLPGDSGMVVLGLIRRLPRLKKTRVIISSGHADAGLWAVKQWGADLFLQKPISLDVLKRTVHEFTRESSGTAEANTESITPLPTAQSPVAQSNHAADGSRHTGGAGDSAAHK